METSVTAVQKLTRIAEIRHLLKTDITDTEKERLIKERGWILDGVSMPPDAVLGNPDPHAWAAAFGQRFRRMTPESCYSWFSNAMLSAAQVAQAPAYEAGRTEGMRIATDGLKELADMLSFIRAGADAGRIKSPMLIDPSLPMAKGSDPEPTTLSAMISRSLKTAGLE